MDEAWIDETDTIESISQAEGYPAQEEDNWEKTEESKPAEKETSGFDTESKAAPAQRISSASESTVRRMQAADAVADITEGRYQKQGGKCEDQFRSCRCRSRIPEKEHYYARICESAFNRF